MIAGGRTLALLRADLHLGVDSIPRSMVPPLLHPGDMGQAVEPSAAGLNPVHPPVAGRLVATMAPVGAPAPIAMAASPPLRQAPVRIAAVDPIPPAPAARSKAQLLEDLRQHHAATCPHCTRATYHRNLVFGEGNPEARLVFVGEAPGETEDRLGRPFVGPAGQKLDEMIRAMGLRREDVYIANVLKSRPPENRTPMPHEVEECGPALWRQLCIIGPEVIVTLGAPAAKFLLRSDAGITRLRGVWGAWLIPEELGGGQIPVMPTFHPAYLLRKYTPETRRMVWSDLQQVMARLQLRR